MSFSLTTPPAAGATTASIPASRASVQTGVTTLTAYDDSDLFSTSIPAALGTNLLSTPVKLDEKFVGVHVPAASAYLYPGGWNRSHDMAPRWNQMNPSSGVFVDAGLGAWLDACKAAQQETVYTIFGTPTWASARPAETGDPYGTLGAIAEPTSMATLSAFVTWLMQTYGSRIDYLEIWNEPKYSTAGGSYFSGTAAKLAEMARTIVTAARAVKPAIKTMGVGCTGVLFNSAGSGVGYTDNFLAASDGASGFGKDWIDIISVHTYAHDGTNDITQLANTKAWIDAIKTTNGVTSKPVWSTEFSYITPDFSNYTGPETGRALALVRYLLWNVIGGMARAALYPLGWNPSAERARLWNGYAAMLNGATVSCINRVGNSPQLACVINGRNYLF